MRAPLLLPLLLLGVSSQDDAQTSPPSTGAPGSIITTVTTKAQETTPASSPSTSTPAPTPAQDTTTTSKPGNPTQASVISSTTVSSTTPVNNPGNLSPTLAMSPPSVQGATPTKNPVNPSLLPATSPQPPQQVSSSTSSRASAATPAATSSITQQKTSPAASLGSSAPITTPSPVLTHMSSSAASTGSIGSAVASSPGVKAQGNQLSVQGTTTTASTRVPGSTSSQGIKDYGVTASTSATKQPHSSASSPGQGLASSTSPGSISISVPPFGSMSPTTSKESLTSPSGSMDKVSEAATTPTPAADQRSHPSTKPASADQSPASAQPPSPSLGDQTASCSPGHQHPNISFQNEVICKDQVQNTWPTMYLKEAKTCEEWRVASTNVSFFESFCSTAQHAFNASRETCTVILSACQPRSQHWAVHTIIHIPLDPEKVLEELKEKKDKLEELGIANITYDRMEREMVITDEFSTPLIITIVTLAGSLLLIAAIYGCCHQRFSQKKDQHIHPDLPGFDDGHVALIFNQRLTEELQTMENGYHDNPTLEVMETSSEMQEKKVNLNGELGDSWIVPLDTLMKEDLEEEEDTHL
ncbi:podocalyxin isoform X1 [Melopsittacus undulatus]|uniref:podocalyxin isoform X1 n=1 Tax=Melopsittacus undulatus TaxID=13146 RepID=UPI00146C0B44|nr:podocalyxin isoform X1 [Melopsittacus undulatus]